MKRKVVSRQCYLSYDEWLDLGRVVRKGQKAIAEYEDGTAVFTPSQTKPLVDSDDDYHEGDYSDTF